MKTILLAAVAAASLSAAPAFAQNSASGADARIEISSAGLDLATAQGRAALDLRVLHAARTACGTPSSADALGRTKADTCVAELRLAAAAQRDTLIAQAQRPGRSVLAGR